MQKALKSPLVSTKWLQDILNSKPSNHRILDCAYHLPITGRKAGEEYKAQHIPGALFFDIDDCADKSHDMAHMLPSTDIFEKYVGDLGINNDTHVIVYDNNPNFPLFSAQRVWWTFRSFGHDKVSILNGGLQKWLADKRPTTAEVISVPQEKFHAKFDPINVKHLDDIVKNIKDSSFQLVDARPAGRFKGTSPEPRADVKPGRIPNTKNIPFMTTLDVEKKCMKSPDQLKQIFANEDVDLNKPLVITCGSGMTACMLVLAAYECGYDQVGVYDGSWTEWYFKAPDDLKLDVPTS